MEKLLTVVLNMQDIHDLIVPYIKDEHNLGPNEGVKIELPEREKSLVEAAEHIMNVCDIARRKGFFPKISIIKALRSTTGCGLREAKEAVEVRMVTGDHLVEDSSDVSF